MNEAGTVLHIAKSGRLIIKMNQRLEAGTVLVDSEGRKAAKVLEVFGPVQSPYASAIPLTDRVKRLLGSRVYILVERRK